MRSLPPLLLLATALLGGGCVKKIAINSLADALSSPSGSTFSRDDDLQLVGDALPFALKTEEALLDQAPDHVGLHLALASGYTQYAVVWVQFPAEQLKYSDFAAYQAGLDRARRLLQRARRYGMAGLDLVHPGFSARDLSDPAALADLTRDDVPLLYWLGASWLATIAISKEDPEAIGQLPTAAALLHRALDLWEDWDRGSIHELLISLEPSLPGPGGADRARQHYARAVELSAGTRASPHVALASGVAVDQQDRALFEELLQKAAEVQPLPDETLANQYAQQRALWLLAHTDDLFLPPEIP